MTQQVQTKGHASKWSYDSEEVTLERIIAEPDLLQFAGHYYVERHNMYNHHFLLSNCDSGVAELKASLVHFDGELMDKSNATVKEESFTLIKKEGIWSVDAVSESVRKYAEALINKRWHLVHDREYPMSFEGKCEAVRSAKSCEGNYPKYDFFNNNCEHFIREILTGKKESKQIEELKDRLDVFVPCLCIVGGILIIGIIFRKVKNL